MKKPLYYHRIRKNRAGRWFWTLFARNGKKVATTGEGYARRCHAERMCFRLFGPLLALLLTVACSQAITPPATPTPPPPLPKRTTAVTVRLPDSTPVTAGDVQLFDDATPPHQASCAWVEPRLECDLGDIPYGVGARLIVRAGGLAEWNERIETKQDLGEIHLQPLDPPILDKTTLIRTAQENFGSIKLPGCGLHLDNLFDPFLLERWMNDRACFERMMEAHAIRGDNTVSVDPRAGYHGFNDADLWHDPATFAAFLRDIRRHTNTYGEHFRVRVFFGGDGHIDNMRTPGAFEHWLADVDAVAAAIEPYIEFTVPCWECRHDNSWLSARQYYDMLAVLARRFPRAVHSVHLVKGSSSPSSWPCDPAQAGSCTPGEAPPANDLDDPARGNEPGGWVYITDNGLADEFLYQVEDGSAYLWYDTWPANADAPPSVDTRGALGRWWDIAVRLGDDPWSAQTACAAPGFCGRRGWRQVAVKVWEFIYDAYWGRDPARATEAYAVEFCKKALAIGGWGCGSASYRRPQ